MMVAWLPAEMLLAALATGILGWGAIETGRWLARLFMAAVERWLAAHRRRS